MRIVHKEESDGLVKFKDIDISGLFKYPGNPNSFCMKIYDYNSNKYKSLNLISGNAYEEIPERRFLELKQINDLEVEIK